MPQDLHVPEAISEEEAPGVLFARNYFGNDADEALELMRKNGFDLESLNPPVPESVVRTGLAERFRTKPRERDELYGTLWGWPEGGASNEYLRNQFSLKRDLTREERLGLDALAEAHDVEVRAAADLYFDSLDHATAEKVLGGEYRLSPYINWPPADRVKPTQATFRTTTRIGGGWVVNLSLEKDRFQDVLDARREANRVAGLRHMDLQAMLGAMGL